VDVARVGELPTLPQPLKLNVRKPLEEQISVLERRIEPCKRLIDSPALIGQFRLGREALLLCVVIGPHPAKPTRQPEDNRASPAQATDYDKPDP
jgi:hypothetical protein